MGALLRFWEKDWAPWLEVDSGEDRGPQMVLGESGVLLALQP